ncbi:MAG TPA: hypothetical protein V6D48_21895, partial [Oculatellaceae cyanobacterium]
MTFSSDLLSGPYTLSEDWPFVAYVVQLENAQRNQFVCFTASLEDQHLLTKNFPEFLKISLAQAAETLANWEQILCIIATLQQNTHPLDTSQSNTRSLVIEPYSGQKTDPAGIAKDILNTLSITSILEIGDKTYKITEFAKEPDIEFRHYQVQSLDSDLGTDIMARDITQMKWLFQIQDELNNYEAGMFFVEAVQFIEGSQWQEAFRSYYYAFRFSKDLDTLLPLGKALLNGLLGAGYYDYADWVANTVTSLAEDRGEYEEAAYALRLAGIAAAMLGRIEETSRYFAHAVDLLDKFSNNDLQTQIHMSYGLALVELFADWETEACYINGDYNINGDDDKLVKPKMEMAILHLETAQTLTGKSADERSRVRLCAIKLDLIRAADLCGKHETALADLDELMGSCDFIETDKLIATALLYRVAILRKLTEKQIISPADYLDGIETAWQRLKVLESKPGDRFCCFLTLQADILMSGDRVQEAMEALWIAYTLQSVRQTQNVRLPGPECTYGGLPVIDLAGKIQTGYRAIAKVT